MKDTFLFNINEIELMNRILEMDSKEENIKELKIQMIKNFILPNIEDKELYKYYTNIELLNDFIRKGRKDKKILDNIG